MRLQILFFAIAVIAFAFPTDQAFAAATRDSGKSKNPRSSGPQQIRRFERESDEEEAYLAARCARWGGTWQSSTGRCETY
jgi:hypothetical protein